MMQIETNERPLMLQDYLLIPDDGKRYELIWGELYECAPTTTLHQRANRNFLIALMDFVHGKGLGEVLPGPLDVNLSRFNVIQPDLTIVSREQFDILGEQRITGSPALLIEIMTEQTRFMDLVRKLMLYQYHNVAEYWIVEPEQKRMRIFERREDGCTEVQSENGATRSVVFPGLEIRDEGAFDFPEWLDPALKAGRSD